MVFARLLVIPALAGLLLGGCATMAGNRGPMEALPESDPERGYWPTQAAAPAYRIVLPGTAGNNAARQVAALSLAGIAARAVNEGRHDELLWVGGGRRLSDEWSQWTAEAHAMEERPQAGLWEAAEVLQRAGLLRGFVLYRHDDSDGRPFHEREGIDESVNAATVLAAAAGDLMLVEESLRADAEAIGLPLVEDARGMTQEEALQREDARLSRRGVVVMDPKSPNLRDFAIAHRLPTTYGVGEDFLDALRRSEPNALVQGWNLGDESMHTQPPTRLGLVQTASNWAWNLVFTMAGADAIPPAPPPAPVFPEEAPPAGGYAAYMVSDGDNVQFATGGFFDESYWGSPLRGAIPIGWTFCGIHLAQSSPATLARVFETMTPNDTLVEFSGGYFYPDLFATEREDRRAALEVHARMLGHRMAQSGSRVLTFICKDVAAEESLEAYQLFADHIPDLVGMIAVQYAPYNGGHGEIFWIESAQGDRVPVLTPRFTIWQRAGWRGGGTPAHIANLVNEHAEASAQAGETAFSLVAVHAWSRFQDIEGDDPRAENIAEDAPPEVAERGRAGLEPISWSMRRLDDSIKLVTPKEMLWRIRQEDARARGARLAAGEIQP